MWILATPREPRAANRDRVRENDRTEFDGDTVREKDRIEFEDINRDIRDQVERPYNYYSSSDSDELDENFNQFVDEAEFWRYQENPHQNNSIKTSSGSQLIFHAYRFSPSS